MRALRGIHHSLRPGGLLLDICPLPEPARVEVERRDGVVPAGQMGREELIGRIHAAQTALDSLVRGGLFVREAATIFEFVDHFDTVEDWLAYREERGTTIPLDEALLARTRTLLIPGAGEVRLREQVQAARLRRTSPLEP